MLSLLLLMSALLGITSYSTGLLPLTFTSSKSTLDQFSLLGAGLLVGTALGVILPEGIETTIRTKDDIKDDMSTSIALPLLLGFLFMLLLDQILSSQASDNHHAHLELKSAGSPLGTGPRSSQTDTVDFDAELNALEREEGVTAGGEANVIGNGIRNDNSVNGSHNRPMQSIGTDIASARKLAMSRSLGLVVHALADGFALGVSSLTDTVSRSLSMVVFMALAVHKAPTSLALSSSLLATGLPREECRKHLTVFSAATPVGALASYFLFSFLGNDKTNWTGVALLASSGSFLYVATVLQSAVYNTTSTEMTRMGRVSYIVAGILLPFVFSAILGHNH